MADAIISVVVERVAANIEQIRKEVNSVRHIEKDVQSLFNNLNIIRNVLDDAESRRFKDKIINNWLSRLEHIAHELEDVLDEWDYATLKHKVKQESNDVVVAPFKRKVSSLISSSFLSFKKFFVCRNIAKKMKNVRKELDELLKEKDQYNFVMSQPTNSSPESWRVQSTSLINLAEIHGRVIDRDILVSKLVSNADSEDELGPHVLSIVGVGGIGKTTLAQLVYNDSQVREYFELRIWICVSDPFDVAGIAKGIIETVKEGSSPNPSQLDMLLKHVIESISGKKFLLVLDDVWTEDSNKWERLKKSLKHGGACSKILVTARNEGVAKMMGATTEDIHHLGQLSNEDCWLLLRRMALPGRNEEEFEKFQDIGKRIANKCKGLPLAAKTLGSLLRSKNTLQGWENLLTNEIWQMEGIELELFPHLLLSYNALSPTLKRCFSYCAIFPKDEKINVESLIENWMALGYLGNNMGSGQDMELKGRECFNVLANHSLFQDFEKDNVDEQIRWCKMHDIIHDFAQFLRKNGRVKDRQAKTTCQFCNPLLVSRVKEYHSLFCQYDQITPNICGCLTSLRILGLRNFHSRSMPQEIGNLIHLRWLDLSYNKSATEDTRTICKLYNLQFLRLKHCQLQEIPREIGRLIHLRHLDLSHNDIPNELPESICGLHELRTLNIDGCSSLCELPQGIDRLIKLKHLHNKSTYSLKQFPQGLSQLTTLCTLSEFYGGNARMSKLGLLKNLNQLTGSLILWIELPCDLEQVVEDTRAAELKKKTHIQELKIRFDDEMDEKEESRGLEVIDALEPHPNLQKLSIKHYEGSKLPDWIASPINQLRHIKLYSFNHLLSLPPLGKLPCLEEIDISNISMLEAVGREFLGITSIQGNMDVESSSMAAATTNSTVFFPKLKKLTFDSCPNWKEWEDITTEEEESAAVSLMPCLTMLTIKSCKALTTLPHRLLHKAAASLKVLDIAYSAALQQSYLDNDGSVKKFISQNPHLQLKLRY